MYKYEKFLKDGEDNKKIGIYLTGAGGKAPFHIGFIKALEDLGIKPDVIFGGSSGAIIGAGATYLTADELYEKWSQVTYENLFNVKKERFEAANDLYGAKKTFLLYCKVILTCLEKRLINIDYARQLINNLLDGKKIKESEIDFGLTTTLMPNCKILNIWKSEMNEDNLLEYIVASMYLPIFKPERILNNKFYLDNCNFNAYPFEVLNDKNCTDILICDTSELPITKSIRTSKRTFDDRHNVEIIGMKDKTSLLDFTENTRIINYHKGYDETIRTLTKKI